MQPVLQESDNTRDGKIEEQTQLAQLPQNTVRSNHGERTGLPGLTDLDLQANASCSRRAQPWRPETTSPLHLSTHASSTGTGHMEHRRKPDREALLGRRDRHQRRVPEAQPQLLLELVVLPSRLRGAGQSVACLITRTHALAPQKSWHFQLLVLTTHMKRNVLPTFLRAVIICSRRAFLLVLCWCERTHQRLVISA